MTREQLIERLRPHSRGLVETTRAQREAHDGARWMIYAWFDYSNSQAVYCKTLDEVAEQVNKLNKAEPALTCGTCEQRIPGVCLSSMVVGNVCNLSGLVVTESTAACDGQCPA